MRNLVRCVVVAWLCLTATAHVPAVIAQELQQPESYLRLHYNKSEHMIPMRDGVKLFTSVFVPRDTTKTYPILMKRTPYNVGPYGEDKYPARVGPSEHFVKAGYIFVNQDVRGRFASEGEFVQVTPHRPNKSKPTDIDESTDTYDTIEWLLKNIPGHNGRVGIYGISYPGFYAAAGMIDAHPALKAVSPQAPVGDWYFDDFLHHGSFFLAHAFRWLSSNDRERPKPTTEPAKPYVYPTPDGYKMFLEAGSIENIDKLYLKGTIPFWKDMMLHPNRDEFWQKRALIPHLKNVAPHVMVVTGWYDAEDLYGSFKTYQSIEQQNPKVNNVLVVGPWHHGGWASVDGDKLGNVPFGSKTAAFYREHIELPFFEKYLKDKDVPAPAEATVFETGSNVWRTFDHWPPKQTETKSLFLHEGGKLSFAPPDQSATDAHFDEFISDPNKPVPYSETITPKMTIEYMVDDQRFASRRPDVLTYQTEPLTEDLVLAGPMEADLWVSTTGTDADWIVKLIDVRPDAPEGTPLAGYQMLVRSEVFRGRFRNDYAKPEPFTPGKPTRVRFELLDVLHRFQKGHRLMVQIQSTWFPLVDRNPQKFVDNIYFAKPEDFQKATHRVYRSAEHPTSVRVRGLTWGKFATPSNPAISTTPTTSRREGPPPGDISATFSIVAVDPENQVCGAAVASKYPAVGKVVPYVRANVGAFCTQHYHVPKWGEPALDLLQSGKRPEAVIAELLKDDKTPELRQLAIIDMQGQAAVHNPTQAPEASRYWGAMTGRFYSCQGNTLTGREVVVSMAKAYEDTAGSLADRLMAALIAADCAGGDHRGRLAAGIRVAKKGVEGDWLSLHVDKSDDAVLELAKKYADLKHEAKGAWTGGKLPFQHPCPDRPKGSVPEKN